MSTKLENRNLRHKSESDKRSLKIHLSAVHEIDPVNADYVCPDYELANKSLRVM